MKYTEEELIEELKRVSEEYCDGEAPRIKDMREYGNISEYSYRKYFGGWNEALKENGYSINIRKDNSVDKKEIIKSIDRVCEEEDIFEKPCTMREYQKYGNIPVPTIQKIFNSWSNAVEESGYSSVKRSRGAERQKEKYEDLKENYIKVSEEYCDGNTPTKKDLLKYGKYSSSLYEKRFGGLEGTAEEFGFEPNYVYSWKMERLEKNYKYVSREYCEGKTPTSEDLQLYGNIPSSVYEKRFGGFRNAAKKFGFEPLHQSEWIGSGEEHPCWKGGYENYYGSSWHSQRKYVWDRDGYECRICGKRSSENEKKPDVHHIVPVRFWNIDEEHEKMNHEDNLITLCRGCHAQLEGKFKGRNHEEFEELAREYLDIEENEEKDSIFDY